MKKFFGYVVFLSLLLCTSAHAEQPSTCTHFECILPEQESGLWALTTRKVKESGNFFEVWTKEGQKGNEERLVIVTAPLNGNKEASLSDFLDSLQTHVNLRYYEEHENEVIFSLLEEGKMFSLCRLLLTPQAFHTISYSYSGPAAGCMDPTKQWLPLLKSAQLVSNSD